MRTPSVEIPLTDDSSNEMQFAEMFRQAKQGLEHGEITDSQYGKFVERLRAQGFVPPAEPTAILKTRDEIEEDRRRDRPR